jgi:hypothetical protein
MQPGRRTGEASLVGDGQKVFKVSQLHAMLLVNNHHQMISLDRITVFGHRH